MREFHVYGGFCKFPEHPASDLSGVVRFCVLASSPTDCVGKLERYGVRLRHSEFGSTWGESQSQAEREATVNHYGDVFFAPTAEAYLRAGAYACDKNLTLKKRALAKKEAEQQGGAVAATAKRPRKDEFP